MFRNVRVSWSVILIVVTVALSALPAAAQAASTTVTIAVPAVQQVDGTTSLVVSGGALQHLGQLVVKSNTPWVLVAHISGAAAGVTWRVAGSATWQQLNAATPVFKGLKGVHQVEYEVQVDGRTAQSGVPVTVTFSVEPASTY